MMRRIFGTEKDGVTGEWRKLRDVELNDLYCSPNNVRVFKSRKIRWTGTGEVCAVFWWGNLRERDHLGDPGLDGKIIIRWIFRKWDVGVLTGLVWLRIGTGGGHL